MKWLSFLKDKAGKFTISTQGALVTSAAVGLGLATAMYNVGTTQAQKEQAVRSLSSISNPHDYGGMRRTADGRLTSIQVRDSLGQLASREDLDRMNNGDTDDFGLNALAGAQRLSFGRVGSAAKTTATEGLGMGGNEAVEVGPSGNVPTGPGNGGPRRGAARVPGAGEGAPGASGGAANPSTSGGGQLTSASMARASGNAFTAASGAVAGGNAGGQGGSSRGGTGGNYRFSGDMPSGSSAVPSLKGEGLTTRAPSPSGFGGNRQGIAGKGLSGLSGRGDLQDISKRSIDIAKNSRRASNEGSRAFLAASQNSAGMTFENDMETTSTGSADFETQQVGALKKLGEWQDNTDKKDEQQQKDRKKLMTLLLVTLASVLVVLPVASYILQLADAAWWLKAIGYALCVAVIGLAAWLIVEAAKYSSNYNAVWFPLISMIVGAGAIAAAVFTMIRPEKLWSWISKNLKNIKSKLLSFVGVPLATTAVTSGINSDK